MPVLTLRSNVEVDDTSSFVVALSSLAARLLQKPEEFVCVDYTVNRNLCLGGSFDPAAVLFITSLQSLPPNEHEYDGLALDLYRFFRQRLGVPPGRVYIHFEDNGREYMVTRRAPVAEGAPSPSSPHESTREESMIREPSTAEPSAARDVPEQYDSVGSLEESPPRRRQRLGWFRRSIRRTRPR